MEENQELDSDQTMRIYEVGFLLKPTLTEKKILETFAAIKEILANQGAIMISESFPKPRPLAYPVKKLDSAFFGWVKFESNSEALDILSKFLKNNDEVIRFLVVKTIRENSIITPVAPAFFSKVKERTGKQEKVKEESITGPKMTTEELDKTIAELVVE
ncbi:MAG TPA: 30S ribosomal protein S6 [Candidatus Paceibacterota bacterium]